MPSRTIEDVDLPVTVGEVDAPPGTDPAFKQVGIVTYTVSHLLEAIVFPDQADAEGKEIRDSLEELTSTAEFAEDREEYLRTLNEAFQCGKALLDRDDLDAVREDIGRLDPETLREVRGTIAYVAPHFNIEVDLPAPEEDRE